MMRITLNIINFWAIRIYFYCICFFVHDSDAYVDYDLCSFVNLWLNWDQLASSVQIAGLNSPLDLYRCYPYFLVDHRPLHHVDIQSNWLFKIKCNILIIKGTVNPKMNVCWKITYHCTQGSRVRPNFSRVRLTKIPGRTGASSHSRKEKKVSATQKLNKRHSR